MIDPRTQRRTSSLSVIISLLLHGAIVATLFFFAAREGMLGKQLRKIAVTMVPKEKPPEKPKEKPPEPKPQAEPPKTETVKALAIPPPETAKPVAASTPAPPASVATTAAPPAADVPSFDFEGGKQVESTSDPNVLYKGFVEYTLRTQWTRPEGIADNSYVAEVELAINREGRVIGSEWKKGSGDIAWDNSIKKALAASTSFSRRPPKGFPDKVLVRFDVQTTLEIPIE